MAPLSFLKSDKGRERDKDKDKGRAQDGEHERAGSGAASNATAPTPTPTPGPAPPTPTSSSGPDSGSGEGNAPAATGASSSSSSTPGRYNPARLLRRRPSFKERDRERDRDRGKGKGSDRDRDKGKARTEQGSGTSGGAPSLASGSRFRPGTDRGDSGQALLATADERRPIAVQQEEKDGGRSTSPMQFGAGLGSEAPRRGSESATRDGWVFGPGEAEFAAAESLRRPSLGIEEREGQGSSSAAGEDQMGTFGRARGRLREASEAAPNRVAAQWPSAPRHGQPDPRPQQECPFEQHGHDHEHQDQYQQFPLWASLDQARSSAPDSCPAPPRRQQNPFHLTGRSSLDSDPHLPLSHDFPTALSPPRRPMPRAPRSETFAQPDHMSATPPRTSSLLQSTEDSFHPSPRRGSASTGPPNLRSSGDAVAIDAVDQSGDRDRERKASISSTSSSSGTRPRPRAGYAMSSPSPAVTSNAAEWLARPPSTRLSRKNSLGAERLRRAQVLAGPELGAMPPTAIGSTLASRSPVRAGPRPPREETVEDWPRRGAGQTTRPVLGADTAVAQVAGGELPGYHPTTSAFTPPFPGARSTYPHAQRTPSPPSKLVPRRRSPARTSQSSDRAPRNGNPDSSSMDESSASVSHESDPDGEAEADGAIGATVGVKRRSLVRPSPHGVAFAAGYEIEVTCSDLRRSANVDGSGSGNTEIDEIRWEVIIRRTKAVPRTGADDRQDAQPPSLAAGILPPPGPNSPLHLSPAGNLAQAPLTASSLNLSLALDQPTGKLVFIAFPMDTGSTPRRRGSRAAGSGTGTSAAHAVSRAEDGAPGVVASVRLPSSGAASTSTYVASPPPNRRAQADHSPSNPPSTPPQALALSPSIANPEPDASPVRPSTPPPAPHPASTATLPSTPVSKRREGVRNSGTFSPRAPNLNGSASGSGSGRRAYSPSPSPVNHLGGGGRRHMEGPGGLRGRTSPISTGRPNGDGMPARASPPTSPSVRTPRWSRIVSAHELDGGLFAPGTVDGLSEDLEEGLVFRRRIKPEMQ